MPGDGGKVSQSNLQINTHHLLVHSRISNFGAVVVASVHSGGRSLASLLGEFRGQFTN
jgi:hypothetical protein